MEPFFLYILKSGICLAVFYISFKALFSNDTFFQFNRWVLLLGTGICLLLPFCRIEMERPVFLSQPVSRLETVFHPKEEFPGISESVDDIKILSEDTDASSISWIELIGISYVVGCCLCLFITSLSFFRIHHLLQKGEKMKDGKYILVLIPASLSPFSWGRYIFLSEDDYRNYPDEILTHERMHLRYHHSLDLVFLEIVLLTQWFNPAVWLLKRELRDIHEYQADNGALNHGIDATKYQLLLVKKAVGSSLYTLANSFNHSKIKKRITMMLKKKSNNWARLKLALLLPVGLAALSAFARPEMPPPPETALSGSSLLLVNKSIVNQETMQQSSVVFLTCKVSGSDNLDCMLCETLEEVTRRIENGQFKNAEEVTVNPAFKDVPATYLEKVKSILEEKGIKCKIDPSVPNTTMDEVHKPARKSEDIVYLIQNGQVVLGVSISKFTENPNDPRFGKLSKSIPILLLRQGSKPSVEEVEKFKIFLEEKGYICQINASGFQKGNATSSSVDSVIEVAYKFKKGGFMPPPPPPPPPAGLIIFSYKSGKADRQFVLYDRYSEQEQNLGQRIDKIYSDDILKVSIKINKNASGDLLERVKQELKKKITYPVQYNILQFVD